MLEKTEFAPPLLSKQAMFEAKELEKYEYSVIIVHIGEQAVETVNSSNDIDLLLMDIALGKGMDGTPAARLILQNHDLPVVFLSSHTDPETVDKTEGFSSNGYVLKNSSIMVLDASIKIAFRLYKAHLKLKTQKQNLNQALTKYGQATEELLEKNEKLKQSDSFLNSVLESIQDGVSVLAPDLSIRYVN